MKTNKQWYPYENLGGYFKLEEDTLMACPMNTDGTRENNSCEVDTWEWDDVGTGVTMEDVIQELQGKE